MESSTQLYQCPGESSEISYAVHLGRLTRFYEKCRTCQHRTDINHLPEHVVKRFDQAEQQFAQRHPRIHAEGIGGEAFHDFTPTIARDLAKALGIFTRRTSKTSFQHRPSIVLGVDGRSMMPEYVSAVAEGLLWSGAEVTVFERSTSPECVWLLQERNHHAAIFLGNPYEQLNTLGMKFWFADGVPLSSGSGLEELFKLTTSPLSRPARSGGKVLPQCDSSAYLESLLPNFHAMRPLKIVVETSCRAWVKQFTRLFQTVAGQVIPVLFEKGKSDQGSKFQKAFTNTALRSNRLRNDLLRHQAHLGIQVDSDGESLFVFDEQGNQVDSELLLLLFAKFFHQLEQPHPIVVEEETSKSMITRLKQLDICTKTSNSTRAKIYQQMFQSQAILGGGKSGRFWFADPRPIADSLRAITLLLKILSKSDRPFSQVIAETIGSSSRSRLVSPPAF